MRRISNSVLKINPVRNKLSNGVNIFRGLILFIGLIAFLASCSQEDTSSPRKSQSATVHFRNVYAKDFAPGQLKAHYLKHRYEFGDITIEEYLNNAKTLLNSPPGKDILEKVRLNGDILHYRTNTKEFAVMTKEGRIRTYFKANYRYWLKQ